MRVEKSRLSFREMRVYCHRCGVVWCCVRCVAGWPCPRPVHSGRRDVGGVVGIGGGVNNQCAVKCARCHPAWCRRHTAGGGRHGSLLFLLVSGFCISPDAELQFFVVSIRYYACAHSRSPTFGHAVRVCHPSLSVSTHARTYARSLARRRWWVGRWMARSGRRGCHRS